MKNSQTVIMGIDFGKVNVIYATFNNCNKSYVVNNAPKVRDKAIIINGEYNPYFAMDNYNLKTAIHIVNIAVKHHVNVIHMESLDGSSFTQNSFYYDLQRQIQYIASTKYIKVKYVERYKTSQKCSNCGYTNKKNRVSQSEFICLKCGFQDHADHNAALNICMAR